MNLVHKFNYDFLIKQGEIIVPFDEMKVLIRKLDLEGLDFHYEMTVKGLYVVEVY